jgi:hypothetical protein
VNSTQARLAGIRGEAVPKSHNARTIAALASNPGCARRAIMDAAGADKPRIAAYLGYPAPFGQSQFAMVRGNAFEAQVKAGGGAELLTLLRATLGLAIEQAHIEDLNDVGGNTEHGVRHAATTRRLAAAVTDPGRAGTMFDHPLLTLEIGGQRAYLEPDLIALQWHGRYHIIEIKSFAVIDGKADGDKVAKAAIQSAVYVLALRQALARHDIPAGTVSDTTILVCPKDFSNQPVAALLDVRKQLTVLTRQLARLDRIEALLGYLPPDLTFTLAPGSDGVPQRDPGELAAAVRAVGARYSPECLNTCEMCFFCRDEAHDQTAALGKAVREDLGGIEQVATVLRLARGDDTPDGGLAEAAAVLRSAARLRAEALGEAV